MAEHHINLGHHICVHHMAILSTKPRYMDRIIREMILIEFQPNSMNREDGFYLNKSWKTIICSLKCCRKPPSHGNISGFSTGPCTVCIRAQNIPSPGTHQPPPRYLSFLLLLHAPLHACDSLTQYLSLTCQFSAQHTRTIFPCLFPRPVKLSLFRAILNSCCCLLLVHLVVT
jgi:hypothetical protein